MQKCRFASFFLAKKRENVFVKNISIPKTKVFLDNGGYYYDAKKTFAVEEFKAFEDSGKFYLSGYANTKNKPDSYGDIPTNYNGQPVYDLSRFEKNPCFFINHDTCTDSIAGNVVEWKEDQIGLFVKVLLMDLADCYSDEVKHSISAARKGFLRAMSIGGRWFFDDTKNPTHLTRAYLYEISLVGVPADDDALFTTVTKPKQIEKQGQVAIKAKDLGVLRFEYKTTQTLNQLNKEL